MATLGNVHVDSDRATLWDELLNLAFWMLSNHLPQEWLTAMFFTVPSTPVVVAVAEPAQPGQVRRLFA